MLTTRTAISIGEAITKVMDDVSKGTIEKLPLMEADGRFLAEDIIANQNVPAFNRSLYDGYAIRAEDTIHAADGNSIKFEVVGEIGAGYVFTGHVGANQAVRIMTGAQMPDDCNAVVMLEDVEDIHNDGKDYILINRKISKGDRVFLKGHEIQSGSRMAKKGTRITAGVIGLLATFGYSEVEVAKKPKVGILATGTELLEIDEPLSPGKIRNSNSYMLMSQVEKAGGQPIYLGKLEDDLEKCIAAVRGALKQVDILITTGGVSVGDYDYLPEIYDRLGAEVLFNKIAMRPGSVTTVAKLGQHFLFGLSGNPSASFIGFELFARPVIRTMLGNEKPHLATVQAILLDDYPTPNGFTQIIRTKAVFKGSALYVSSNGLNMSSSITSLVGANSLVILPPSAIGYEKGEIVETVLLTDDEGQEESIFCSFLESKEWFRD